MRLMSVRELRLNPGNAWRALETEREIVVTSKGTPVALLTGINAQNLEDTLAALRRAKAQMAVSRMRQRAMRGGLSRLSSQEIGNEIKTARKGRS